MSPRSGDGGTAVGRKRPWLPSRTRSAAPAELPAVPAAGLTVRPVGGAWLVHPATGPDRRSLLFAAGLAADPEYAVVVVDLPPEAALDAVEDAVARAVPSGPRGLRLVFGRPPARGPAAAGRRLAEGVGQDVVVPDGVLLPSAGGALFIAADRGRGWVLCTPEGQDRYVSRRFPRPAWDGTLPDSPWPVGKDCVAEPVGAGVWVRPACEDTARHHQRRYLAARLRCRDDAATVVIGAPAAAEPVPQDIARLWRELPEDVRATVRVVPYGDGIRAACGDRSVGDTLAALTGEPVHVYNGFPTSDPVVGRAPLDEVLFLEPDGTTGRPVFSREYLHLPPEPGGPGHPPLAVDHRWPLDHLPMLRRGLYRSGSGAALEVLPWGLWIRPVAEPPYAHEVRAALPDPHHELILCDDSVPEALPRLQRLAEDVVRRLPPETGLLVRVLTADRPWRVPAACAAAQAPQPEAGQQPGTTASEPVVGELPSDAGESPPEEAGSSTREPANHPPTGAGSPKDAALVALALQRSPALGGDRPPAAVLAGLLAARLQLTVHGRRAAGEGGEADGEPAPPTAQALEGLAMLPVHDGVVTLRTELGEDGARWYAAHRQVVEHGVCAASLTGNPGRAGDADIVIRSVTGRRTALLEPESPDRVLFPPDTRFEVLDVRVRRGERTVVMMRELPLSSFPPDDPGRTAVRELEEALRTWRFDEEAGLVRDGTPDPFMRAPGLGYPDPAPEPSGAGILPVALSERFR
ncbi:hypothetical protein ABZX30_37195 [Streptomyces sp. NPDC004542]|uniref:hypothetical protein n=1 Tax=Streptomyces sp. NPDC004542 TaxID=3154281 RepID=UPI0033B07A78